MFNGFRDSRFSSGAVAIGVRVYRDFETPKQVVTLKPTTRILYITDYHGGLTDSSNSTPYHTCVAFNIRIRRRNKNA